MLLLLLLIIIIWILVNEFNCGFISHHWFIFSYFHLSFATSTNYQYGVSGAFEDPEIIHVDDIVDPVRDLEVITEELRLKVFHIHVLNK